MLKNMYENERRILKECLPLRLPLCVSIEPTNLCNFKCVMCFHGNNVLADEAKPLKNMEDEVFQKTLDDLEDWTRSAGEKIKLIKLYSLGEPLVNPRLCDMVKAVKDRDIADQIEITTNGSLMTKEISEKLVEYGLDIIRFSVYGIEKERNRYITKTDFTPAYIRENVRFLYECREKAGSRVPKIYAKMLNENEEVNNEFIRMYRDITDVVGIDEVFNIDVGEGNNVFENYYGTESDKMHESSFQSNIFQERRSGRYPFTHMTVRNDGTVIVCCSDWLKELKIGDVKEHTLKEIWESKTLYDMRMKMLNTKGQCFKACRSCEIPYRDMPEDSVDGIDTNRFSYENEY